MNELQKLAKIVTNRRKKNHPLHIFKQKAVSKEQLFLVKLLDGSFKNEAEVALQICGTSPNDSQFKMLKHRLRKKLYNNLLFLDFTDSKIKVSHRYEEKCRHLLHQAHILRQVGEAALAEKKLKAALKIAEKAEFTAIMLECLQVLASIYAYAGRSNQFYPVTAQINKLTEQHNLEKECELNALTARLELKKSVRARKNFLPTLLEMTTRMKQLWEQTGSYSIFENYYTMQLWYLELTGNFEEIVKITQETEHKLQDEQINQMRFDHRYNKFINVSARLRIKDYDMGLAAAADYIRFFDRSSNNWFVFMENYFLLAFQSGDYRKAHILSEMVATNELFPKINPLAQERWKLYRTYLYFFSPNEKLIKNFNYYGFINDVPEYSRDKQGFNVAILIIQFIYFLRKNDVESLLSRIESVRKYISTHLRDAFSERSRLFFKLLMLIVQNDYNPKACRENGAKLHQKLKEIPQPGDAFAEIEIIPYEKLWEMILKILEEKEKN